LSSTVEGHRKSDAEGDYSIIADVAYLVENKDVRVGEEEAVNAQSTSLANASIDEELLQSMFILDGDTLPIGQLNIELVPVTTAQALTLGSVFPNPFSNQVTITFTLTSSKNVKLTVYDGFGYWHTEETHFSTGQHQFQLSQGLTQLPSGRALYFALETDDQVLFGSFIKQ